MRTLFNRGKKKEVVVAVSGWEIEVGSAYSVVLRKIGVSARKLGSARLNGVGGGAAVLVKSNTGKPWVIKKVRLLKVEGRDNNKDGFKVIR